MSTKKTWVVLDCNYLCYRSLYSVGELSYEGNATGVIYGFLKDIETLQDRFGTPFLIFCWDYGKGKREKQYSWYKQARREKVLTEEEIALKQDFQKQVCKLRDEYLPQIGFANVFYQDGYESDDIIAAVCNGVANDERAVIVTADQDLFQCIKPNVAVYSPHKDELLTLQKFKVKYGILPADWVTVKAVAGCSTDGVAGVRGVGQITAIKWIRGQLKHTTKAFRAIEAGGAVIEQNLKVVKLPLPGLQRLQINEDHISRKVWRKITESLGMKSIAGTTLKRRQGSGKEKRQGNAKGFGIRT